MPVKFSEFSEFCEIVNNCIKFLNIENTENLIEKYKFYYNNIKAPSFTTESLNFYSKYNTKIEYYLSRGWPMDQALKLLKKRQGTYTEKRIGKEKFKETKIKHAQTFSSNYKKGKHKKFLRPSELAY